MLKIDVKKKKSRRSTHALKLSSVKVWQNTMRRREGGCRKMRDGRKGTEREPRERNK